MDPPAFDDPDVQKRADELEAQYQAALEASRSAPSLSTSEASDEDESIDTMQAEEEVEHVGDVTRKVDGLVSLPPPILLCTVRADPDIFRFLLT